MSRLAWNPFVTRTLNLWSSCLSLPSVGIIGVHHHAWFDETWRIEIGAFCLVDRHSTNLATYPTQHQHQTHFNAKELPLLWPSSRIWFPSTFLVEYGFPISLHSSLPVANQISFQLSQVLLPIISALLEFSTALGVSRSYFVLYFFKIYFWKSPIQYVTLAWSLLCTPGWPSGDPPALTSSVLGLLVWARLAFSCWFSALFSRV